jgi:methionine sulfoxide reductase heme-binding subunit
MTAIIKNKDSTPLEISSNAKRPGKDRGKWSPVRKLRIFKVFAFIGLLLPFLLIVIRVFNQALGADPQQAIIRLTGEWSFIILMITLSVSPFIRLTKISWLVGARRMIGLFVFFYASLHLTSFTLFYLGGSLSELASEIVERPYIVVGFIGWLLLLMLAVTSPNAIRRRLKKHWTTLHQSIYFIAILSCLHYIWLVKSDLNKPIAFTLLVAILLGERAGFYWRKKRTRAKIKSKNERG